MLSPTACSRHQSRSGPRAEAPETDDLAALIKLWPSFAVYVVSFAFLAIYWINHHAIETAARRATASLIWANNALLFCLSLIPFATGLRRQDASVCTRDDDLTPPCNSSAGSPSC